MSKSAKLGVWVGGLSLLIVAPFFLQSTSFAYVIRLAGIAGIYMLLALGLNLVVGFVGLLDLGFMAFYAIGAYTSAILAIHKVPFIFCIAAAIFSSVLVRVIVGFPALRLRGDYLAIVTLGFGEVVRLILSNWESLTNGPRGLPRVGETLGPSSLFGFVFSTNLHYYYLILACALAAIWICTRLDHSRLGRAWVAIREDEIAAELMGVDVTKQKMVAFGLSAVFAGLAGAIFAHWEGFVTPESFTFWESALLVCAVVLGGMGVLRGLRWVRYALFLRLRFCEAFWEPPLLMRAISCLGYRSFSRPFIVRRGFGPVEDVPSNCARESLKSRRKASFSMSREGKLFVNLTVRYPAGARCGFSGTLREGS